MKLKTILLASATAMVGAAGAQAGDYKGLYGKIGAGLTEVQEDRDFETPGSGLLPQLDSELDYDSGVGVFSAIGYEWGNSWRTELEFSYRDNDVRHIAPDLINGQPAGFSGFPEGDLSGGLQSYALLANVIYDFDQLSQSSGSAIGFTPYVGGGFGGAIVDLELSGANPAAINGISPIDIDESRGVFAYQGIAGVEVDLAENLVLDLSYRYFGTTKRGFEGTIAGIATEVITTPNSHNFFAGLRWNFGAAPAVAPRPAPVSYKDCWDGSSVPVTSSCPPEINDEPELVPDPIQVTVYFDYDKSNLTSEASSLIDEAVRRANQFDVDTVRVVGNTDTSGSSAYNQALSERRGRVVRDALIARGVPAGIISTNAAGETNLAKPTPDGTREPLNRRSDITIVFE